MISMRTCMAILCMAACGATASAAEQRVQRQYRDLDGDGMPEAILENEYVQVAVMTGEPAAEIPAPVELPNGRKVPYKYANRFNWGGWIYNITFKPTGRKWFVNDITHGEHRHGIPEVFEEAVLMAELTPGTYAAMVPGIGTVTGTGLCFRASFRDVQHAPWTLTEERLEAGEWKAVDSRDDQDADGWRLIFSQEITTEYGYGCSYRKVLTLLAGDSALRCHRELKNTGEKDFKTDWFTHGFWGMGADNALDHDCWSVVPLRPPQVPGSPYSREQIDVERGLARSFVPGYYWGGVSREEIGGNWHACGNRSTKDIFLNHFNRDLAFFRMWTCDNTYSYEPFLAIDLKAGETFSWDAIRAAANGLEGAKATGEGGILDWSIGRSENGQEQIVFKFLPFTTHPNGLALTGTLQDIGQMQPISVKASETDASPLKTWDVTLPLMKGLNNNSSVKVMLTVKDSQGNELVTVNGLYRFAPESRACWHGDGQGAAVEVFGDMGKAKPEEYKHSFQTVFWDAYLSEAGFKVGLKAATDDGADVDWDNLKLAVVAAPKISQALLKKLEGFARRGGAVVVAGGIDYRQYELSDLLPIQMIYGECNMNAYGPRDCTREPETISQFRYHLKATGNHPVTNGLPWYPESCQGVGIFQRVIPKPDAKVLLNVAPGTGMSDAGVEYPALIARKCGKGNVLFFACPTAWGLPSATCMWGRLGEYHQKFLVQMALWAIQE